MANQPPHQSTASWSADLPSRTPLTENDMQQMASNGEDGPGMIKKAMESQQAGFLVSEKVIQSAASNRRYAIEVLDLLMENGSSDVPITEQIVCAAARNSLAVTRHVFQYHQRTSFPSLENSLLAVLQCGEDDERTAKMVEYIIKQFPDARISSRVLEAACTKSDVMQVLLGQYCDPLPILEIIQKIATGNYEEARVLQLLLDRNLLDVDEWVMKALAPNGFAFENVITSQPHVPITPDVLLAAATDEHSLGCLMENRLDEVVITEEVMMVVARSEFTTAEILHNTESVPITKNVVKEAAFYEQPDLLGAFFSLKPDLDPLAIWDEIWVDENISAERKYRATRALFLNADDVEVTPSKLQSYPYDPEQRNNYGLDEVILELADDDRILPINEDTTEIILERCGNKAIQEALEYEPDMPITYKLLQAAKKNPIADRDSLLSFLAEKRGQ